MKFFILLTTVTAQLNYLFDDYTLESRVKARDHAMNLAVQRFQDESTNQIETINPFEDGLHGNKFLLSMQNVTNLSRYLQRDLQVLPSCQENDVFCRKLSNFFHDSAMYLFGNGISDSLYHYYLLKAHADLHSEDLHGKLIDLNVINNYGCWCVFDDEALNLRPSGKPQDKIDELCRDYHMCLKCAIFDSNEDCNPHEVQYETTVSFNLLESCTTGAQQEGTCAHGKCACETNFFSKILDQKSLVDISEDNSFSALEREENCYHFTGDHKNEAMILDFLEAPTFRMMAAPQNQDNFLIPPRGGPEAEVEHDLKCCGENPAVRRPYITGRFTQCCHNRHIFNNVHLECCDDGTVVAIGSQCS